MRSAKTIMWTTVVMFFAMAAGPDPMRIVARHSTTAPASRPTATTPTSPLTTDLIATRPGRWGTIVLSDGTRFCGAIWTTLDKPFRVYIQAERLYRDVPISAIKRITAEVLWERMVDDWRWKQAGSDVKVLTGRKYPARQTIYRFELTDGASIIGDVAAPLWIRCDKGGNIKRFILHKRQKGALGETLEQLLYVREVLFNDESSPQDDTTPPPSAVTRPSSTQPTATGPTSTQASHIDQSRPTTQSFK